MISNILPIVALAGAAMAACPLTVEITGAADHVAEVAITNTGSEALTIFKGNTVLHDHATRDLLVTDASGTEIPFSGVYINYKRTDLGADMFQMIQAGETITTSVNAAKSYQLAGVDTALVSAVQNFQYMVGTTAPTTLKGLEACLAVSAETTIVPNQSLVARDHIGTKRAGEAPVSRINKRSITYHSCTAAQTTALTTTVGHSISMAKAAYTAAGSAADYFTTWFKSTSEESAVRTIYNDVSNVQTTSPLIYCTDLYGDCADGSALLYTVPSDNTIVPCPSNGFWGFAELASACSGDDYDRAGSILHEMTHLYGTLDWAYGPTAAQALSAAHAAANADTYEMYAESVRLGGCTTG